MVLNNKKYTLTKKRWITLSIIVVVLLSILTYSLLKREKEIVFETYTVESTTSEKLSDAFRNKEITTDEYVLYSAYSIYDSSKLDDKYKSNSKYEMAPDLYTLVKNYENELSEDTIEYINNKIQMKNVILGPETNETSYNSSNVVPVSNSGDVKSRLDKYILSPNGKVVVWYTTKDGVDKITDEHAKTIADNVETYIEKYSSEYGIEFKWEKSYLNYYDETKYRELLNNINPTDGEKLFNAMPIYVSASTDSSPNDSSRMLAYYTSIIPNENYSDQGHNAIYNTLTGIPVGPYINVVSTYVDDIDSLKSVIAHELFHHYQNYICGEGTYSFCESNINGDPFFILETTANWAAAKITDKSKAMSHYSVLYLNSYNKTIDDINPYNALNFLKEYENLVDNGKQKIINGLLKKYHNGDTLKYLYNESNNKIPEIMKNLSKNIIIGNYEQENFNGYDDANLYYLCLKNDSGKCVRKELANVESSIEPVAMEYFVSYKDNKKFKISNLSKSDTTYINVFSLSDYKQFNIYGQTVDGFENQKVIYSQKLTDSIIVDLSKIDGEYIMISITNGSLDDQMNYKIEETNEEQNIEFNTENNENSDDSKNNRPDQVYNIYVDGDKKEINNFELNSRAFVNISDLCPNIGCIVNYTDNNYNKISVTRDFKLSNNTYKYTLINEKGKEMFDSNLTAGNVNFELSQFDVEGYPSCPEGKDGNGYDIPSCDKNSYYVPIRFVSQALGYDVEWDEANNRIDINSGLQDELIKENNIRTVLSKDKIDMGNVVTNIIELDDSVTLDANSKYYAYSIDKDNKRVYNSGFSLISGSKNNFKIVNDLDIDKNQKSTYSTLETGSNNSSATISIVTRITIPSENSDSKGGIYPIIKELKVNIKK